MSFDGNTASLTVNLAKPLGTTFWMSMWVKLSGVPASAVHSIVTFLTPVSFSRAFYTKVNLTFLIVRKRKNSFCSAKNWKHIFF